MEKLAAKEITRLLHAWRGGDKEAIDLLIPLVYDELHALASRQLAHEWRHDRLQTTTVVHEAYVRLFDQANVDWQNRGHFFAIAAQVMRRVLVDHARKELREKRGGRSVHVGLEDVQVAANESSVDVVDTLALDSALHELEAFDPDQGRIVELRFFGGLTVEETAAALGISPATVKREWAIAKAWLYRRLSAEPGQPGSSRQ
jgi:RNA polymerase sigma factor (TIGR02999 family)